nr:DUF2520 domain-containing protein [Actinomycetota bacterium]
APDTAPAYRALAERTAARASAAGLLTDAAADEVRAALRESP